MLWLLVSGRVIGKLSYQNHKPINIDCWIGGGKVRLQHQPSNHDSQLIIRIPMDDIAITPIMNKNTNYNSYGFDSYGKHKYLWYMHIYAILVDIKIIDNIYDISSNLKTWLSRMHDCFASNFPLVTIFQTKKNMSQPDFSGEFVGNVFKLLPICRASNMSPCTLHLITLRVEHGQWLTSFQLHTWRGPNQRVDPCWHGEDMVWTANLFKLTHKHPNMKLNNTQQLKFTTYIYIYHTYIQFNTELT